MRPALLLLAAIVVALVLFGPALLEPLRGESPSRAPAAEHSNRNVAEGRTRRGDGCFGVLRPGERRKRPACERIRERRGGVETRLGSMEVQER